MSDDKLPVRIEIGAKAGIDVKATIPEPSAGRFVDAITDLISPLTQWAGLRGDQLRLQRLDTALKIAEKTKYIISHEQGEKAKIPLKTIVPLIEKASLEDDEALQDWWAQLIASAYQDKDLQHPIFADFMGKITSSEAKFLNYFVSQKHCLDRVGLQTFSELYNALVYFPLRDKFYSTDGGTYEPKYSDTAIEEITLGAIQSDLLPALNTIGVGLVSRHIAYSGKQWDNPQWQKYGEEISALSQIGIFRRRDVGVNIISDAIGEFSASCDIFEVTSIGARFIRACIGRGKK